MADQHREHQGVRLRGARMKLVGTDRGRMEHEELIDPSVGGAIGACGGRRCCSSERDDITE